MLLSSIAHAQPAIDAAAADLATTKTWGAILNPTGEVPEEGFKAIYINTQNSRHIVASEVVPEISINYIYDSEPR